ncbi:hypothetical protein [Celeribacter indicus]|uniref:Phosphoadenosine phosphosulfate reductase n=1 Tax=Celeribacter indicus TaxID=1208324 RepID=A0A0B5DXD2_9RHOB|nr:hypothetical protein [Celeribacter indicus]AJE48103.1 hypothetical protein P73_3388 [Celeribacter indicus]
MDSALQTAVRTLEDISNQPRKAWCDSLEVLAEEHGYYQPLGDSYAAAFLDDAPRLLVTFDSHERATERTDNGYPHGMTLAAQQGWSSLTLLSHGPDRSADWFRAPEVYGYFDRLVDEGFFEDFDQVVFYGAGAFGYAAAAYSVAAPGATVVAISPQATLDGRLASWDHRFPETRRMDFSSRYGFAPDMIEGAEKAVVLYDPHVEADAMHAALFHRPHVTRVPCRLFGADPEFEMMEMDALAPLLEAAMRGALTRRDITRALRSRREHNGYLRRLLSEVGTGNRPFQTVLLCGHVLSQRKRAPRFRRAYDHAVAMLEEQGRPVPGRSKMPPDRTQATA